MKSVFLILTLLAAKAVSQACDAGLLDSYDLESSKYVLKEKNVVCPIAKKNCCNYQAQLQIYKKWVVNRERKKILGIYKEFRHALSNIHKVYARIEGFAQIVYDNTIDIPKSNCNKIAKTINKVLASKHEKMVAAAARKAFKFLYESRRGFYCTICDQRNHKYFNLKAETVTVGRGFCSLMIKNTLNYFLYRFVHFMKITRLYGEFMTKCNLDGRYFINRYLKHDMKFYRQNIILEETKDCKKALKTPEAFRFCAPLCQRFNPVKYDKYFEGELDKMFAFERTLVRMSDEADAAYLKKTTPKDLNIHKNPKQRILAEKKKKSKKPKKEDEDVNEISKFNQEFKTALIAPITYKFDEDLTIKHTINYDESIIGVGLDKIYELLKFKMFIDKKGVNWYIAGKTASITRGSAVNAFAKANPGGNAKELDKLLGDL